MGDIIFKISQKTTLTFLVVLFIVLIGIGVVAFGTTNPSDFGHSLGELDLGPINVLGDFVAIGVEVPTAKVHIQAADPEGVPTLMLVAASNGEIATNAGEALRFGHWDGSVFSEAMKIGGDGNVRFQGSISFKCPPDTTRIGMWCIDNVASRGKMGAAHRACDDRGMIVCPGGAIALCDFLETETSECKIATDAHEGDHLSDDIFTSDHVGAVTKSHLSNILCFKGQGNKIKDCTNDETANYFCCSLALT